MEGVDVVDAMRRAHQYLKGWQASEEEAGRCQ